MPWLILKLMDNSGNGFFTSTLQAAHIVKANAKMCRKDTGS